MSPEATKTMGIWTAIGIAIGVAIGSMLDNIAMGIAIGAGIGAALGTWEVERGGTNKQHPDEARR